MEMSVRQRSSVSSSIANRLSDLTHYVAAIGYCLQLWLNRSDTTPTYHYGRHLDQTTFFKNQFRSQIVCSNERSACWRVERLFVDTMPRFEELASCPNGSVGREFYDMMGDYRAHGLADLRSRRMKARPEEQVGLVLTAATDMDFEQFSAWITARRNIFISSTHDLCHLLLGASTDIAGEAVVARYQYRTLLSAQNWLNMVLSLFVYTITLRLRMLAKIRSAFRAVDRAGDYSNLDFDRVWPRQLTDVRKELGLPEEGLMPHGQLAG